MKKTLLFFFTLLFLVTSCKKEDKPIKLQSITFDKTSINIKIGEAIKIIASLNPYNSVNGKISWSSADNAIAIVSEEGIITAMSIGQTVITVINEDNTVSNTISVTVSPIDIASLSISKTELSMKVGAEEQLSSSIQPTNATNKKVTWISSNPEIATVTNNGLVKAVGVGKVKVTVSSEDGKFTASCEISVSAIPVESIIIKQGVLLTLHSGTSEKLDYEIYPSNATNKRVVWESQDPLTVSVTSDGVVSAKEHGYTRVIVKTVDGGHSASLQVTSTPQYSGISIRNSVALVISGSVSYMLNVNFTNLSPFLANIEKVSVFDSRENLIIENSDVNKLVAEVGAKSSNTRIAAFTFGVLPDNFWKTKVYFKLEGKRYVLTQVVNGPYQNEIVQLP